MNDGRPPLWNEMSALAGIDRWRIGWTIDTNLPEEVEGNRESIFILGQEWHFHNLERVQTVLRLIEEHLELDPMTWRDQAYFFENLFRSFFRDRDDPAWMCIVPCRRSFPQRIRQIGGRDGHAAQIGRTQCLVRDIGSERLWLNDTSVSTTGLRMFHRGGVADPHLRLQQVFVHRTLRDDGLGRPLTTTEEWLYLVSPDSEEMNATRRGFNLTIEGFRDPCTGVQSSPIITLCRMASQGRRTLARAFTVRPHVGDVVDIRPLRYLTEYMYRSNLQTPTMLRRLLTPGGFELLDHG